MLFKAHKKRSFLTCRPLVYTVKNCSKILAKKNKLKNKSTDFKKIYQFYQGRQKVFFLCNNQEQL